MKTLSSYFGSSSYYRGERGHWLVVATITRDADCLSRSNFRCMAALLGGSTELVAVASRKGSTDLSENLAIEESSHWAVGWVQYLIVNPDNATLVDKAEKALEKLENYPVLNDDDFSQLVSDEANEVWQNCYNERERIKYIREHPGQFEFVSFEDMLGCVRGKYFAGYASELIN